MSCLPVTIRQTDLHLSSFQLTIEAWILETGNWKFELIISLSLTPLQGFVNLNLMKPIKYDRHAKRRMRDRHVTEDEVKSAIEDPDFLEQSIKGRLSAFKLINGRYLRVTFKEEPDHILVITVTIRKKPFKE